MSMCAGVLGEDAGNTRSLILATDLYKNTVVLLFLVTLFAPGYEAGILSIARLFTC